MPRDNNYDNMNNRKRRRQQRFLFSFYWLKLQYKYSIMGKESFKYSNNEVTVMWKPNTCIHSTLCWKGLIQVFNPREKPWIKMDGATTEKIIEQVRKCPSGALSYYRNDELPKESGKVMSESASTLKIEVSPNGPYLVKSECLIIHSDGKEETKTGTIALCRCGASGNKPYCDGSHRKIDFQE